MRSASPLTINCTPEGSLFILGNPVARNREVLTAWPLASGYDRLEPAQVVLDTTAAFGLFRNRFDWYADHPIAAVVNVNENGPRGILTQRLASRVEVGYDLPPTAWTGTRLYEVRG